MSERFPPQGELPWQIYRHPDIGGDILKRYQEAISEIASAYTPEFYDRFAQLPLNCYQATEIIEQSFRTTLDDYGLKAYDSWVLFQTPVTAQTGKHSGQAVVTLSEENPQICAVVDVAAYLYGFPYRKMPVALGPVPVIEEAFSQLYTAQTGAPVSARFVPGAVLGIR